MSGRYEFIEAEKDTLTELGERKYTITKMCEWLQVSTSGYYEWRGRSESATAERHAYLALLVGKAFELSDETYGYRRLHAQLVRWGETCSPELVRGIMRELGTGIPRHQKFRNLRRDGYPRRTRTPRRHYTKIFRWASSP